MIGTKKLRELALLIGIIMVLTNAVFCEGSCDFSSVKSAKIYAPFSRGFVGLKKNGTSQFELVANMESKHLYTIKVYNLNFLLYDPHANRYICLRKDRKKLVPRKTLPRNLDLCTFVEETTHTNPYVKYVNRHYNHTLAFNKKGHQIINKKQFEKHKQSSRLLVNFDYSCKQAKTTFCKLNPKRRHRHRKEIADICMH